MSLVDSNMDKFINILMNDRLKYFQLNDNQLKQAREFDIDMFSWYLNF